MSIIHTGLMAGTIALLTGSAHANHLTPQQGIGIRSGDTVMVATGMGWANAIVIGANQNNFHVHIIGGPDVTKTYPTELRRKGEPNAYDRANGIYELGDRVQVNFQGQWVDSRIKTVMGMEYQVELPGDKMAWAKPEQIRFVSVAPPKEVAKAGQAPRPGLVSCAGKIEGRYAASGAMPVQMTFRAGKVTFTMMGDSKTGDCWMGGGKLVLTLTGEEGVMEIDINDDGSLQAPFGEMTKKGK